MPIKFRCNFCHQFLGISRNRAGGIVDCPNCGRSIRVPDLDGSVQPIADPARDEADGQLARALDELAALAHVDGPLAPVVSPESEPENDTPQPLPEPIPVEISLPAPVVVEQASVLSTDNSENSDIPLRQILSELVAAAPAVPPPATPSPPPSLPTWVNSRWGMILLASFAPVLAAILGFAAGRGWNSREASSAPAAIPQEPEVALPVEGVPLHGRITYASESGEIRPDAGAAILILPLTWEGAFRLPPMGLRPADVPVDQRVAEAAAQAMQGQLLWANPQGEYQGQLKVAGPSRILVLSRLAARTGPAQITPEEAEKLSGILQDPAATVGRRAYHLAEAVFRTNSDNVWDYQFSR